MVLESSFTVSAFDLVLGCVLGEGENRVRVDGGGSIVDDDVLV